MVGNSAVVYTEQLTKDFPVGFWRPQPHRALDDLSIEIPSGAVFGLLGPNGAGKSTTLKLILNLIWPTSGRASVFGRPAGHLDARRRLGFLPENPTFYDQLTAEELLEYFAGLFGFTREERRRRAARVLDEVGLTDGRRRPLRQLSKGTVQRVGLAAALVNDAELVILDEPMSGLDPIGRRDVREIILRLRDEGRTVLFSSHILSDAELLCSQVAILDRGRLVAAGSVRELTSKAGRHEMPGWDLVAGGVTPEVLSHISLRARRVTRIADDRYSIEVPADTRPESLVTELITGGAQLVSVTPLKTTLEDAFLSTLASQAPAPQPSSTRQRTRPSTTEPQNPSTPELQNLRTPEPQHPRTSEPVAFPRVRLVAWHVFKESVRDRVLYSIVAFAVVLASVSLLIGQITAGQDLKIVKDVGLATIEVAGLLISVFIGIGLVSREIDRRSIQSLLAKPLPRWEFVVGKYLGLLLTVCVNVALMTVAFYVVLACIGWISPENVRKSWEAPAADPALLLAIALILGELALVTAIALCFSTFSSSALISLVFTLGVWVVGLESEELRHFGDLVESPAVPVVSAIGWLVPAFSVFDIKADIVHGHFIPVSLVLWRLLYALVYSTVAVGAGVVLFSRREFR